MIIWSNSQILRRVVAVLHLSVLFLFIGGSQVALGQVANGTYKIVNRKSGQILGISGHQTANGAPLISYPYVQSIEQQWTLTSLGGGQYTLISASNGRSIHVAGNSTVAGAALQLWDYSSTDRVTLVDQGGGYYSIVFVNSGLAAQVSTGEPTLVNGNPVLPNSSLQFEQKLVQGTYDSATLNAQWTFLSPTDGSSAGADFSMVALPDTQCQSAGIRGSTPQNFYDQTNWINANISSKNIKYVAGVGDITQSWGTVDSEWHVASAALYSLNTTVPYGTVPGNHDYGPAPTGDPYVTLAAYNTWFGPSNWTGKSYYGGNYDDGFNNGAPSNGSHYDLISASGLDFIIVYMTWRGTESPANWAGRGTNIAWVNDVLRAYPNRRAIVVSHQIIGSGAQWSEIGQSLYDGIKNNANLFLMLCGHVAPCHEAVRRDTYNGRTVHTMLLDYQDGSPALDMGGNGILRLLTFKPKENLITSDTFSPSTNVTYYRFSIPYQMHDEPAPLATQPSYYMLVNKGTGKAVDLIGGSSAENAVTNQWTYDYNSLNQHWAFVPSENMNHFKIISQVSGKALTVLNSSVANGAQIVQADYIRNNPAQQWDIVEAANGWLQIRNVNSGKNLDADNLGTNGAQVRQWTPGPTASQQQWRLQPWGDYYVQASTGKYLSIQGGSTANYSPIVQAAGQNNPWFKWRFESVGEGYYKVSSLNVLSKALCVFNAQTSTGANCHLYTYNTGNAGDQKVRLKLLPNGRAKFYFVHDGMSWDIPGDSINDVQLQQNTEGAMAQQQQFLLQRAP